MEIILSDVYQWRRNHIHHCSKYRHSSSPLRCCARRPSNLMLDERTVTSQQISWKKDSRLRYKTDFAAGTTAIFGWPPEQQPWNSHLPFHVHARHCKSSKTNEHSAQLIFNVNSIRRPDELNGCNITRYARSPRSPFPSCSIQRTKKQRSQLQQQNCACVGVPPASPHQQSPNSRYKCL